MTRQLVELHMKYWRPPVRIKRQVFLVQLAPIRLINLLLGGLAQKGLAKGQLSVLMFQQQLLASVRVI